MSRRRDLRIFAPILAWGQVSGRLSRRGFWPTAIALSALIYCGLRFDQLPAILCAAVLIWPMAAAASRRLHDMGRTAWWLLLAPVPLANFFLLGMLLRPADPRPKRFRSDLQPLAPSLLIAAFAVIVATVSLTTRITPIDGPSMKPGILPGDVVLSWRWSYGVSRASCAPLSCPPRIITALELPARGDVVTFLHPVSGQASAGRVIARGGETLTMAAGVPAVDGKNFAHKTGGLHDEIFDYQGPARVLPRCRGRAAAGIGATCHKHINIETLPEGRSYIVLDTGASAFDRLAETTVPDGSVFMMGDNRSNAADSRLSRAVGGTAPVAQEAIIGRAALVLWSVDGPWWQIWHLRPSRVLKAIR